MRSKDQSQVEQQFYLLKYIKVAGIKPRPVNFAFKSDVEINLTTLLTTEPW